METTRPTTSTGNNEINTPPHQHIADEAPKKTTFKVCYLGNSVLDKRYTLPMLPWVMLEIKNQGRRDDISLQILPHTLRALKCGVGDKPTKSQDILFEHNLQSVSKFSRSHHDHSIFAYLTRDHPEAPFSCYVFQAGSETMVPELFREMREATKLVVKHNQAFNKEGHIVDSMGYLMKTGCHFYEVLYIGKRVVSHKKAPPKFIDITVEQFRQQEAENIFGKPTESNAEERKRHDSGTSTESLPADLQNKVKVTENLLVQQSEMISTSSTESNHSNTSSDLSVTSEDLHHPESPKQGRKTSFSPDTTFRHPAAGQKPDLARSAILCQRDTRMSISNIHIRTMLLQIGVDEICLISPDKKSVMLHRKFKDISFCSQGIKEADHFGFIAREASTGNFVCYLFRGAMESVVDEIMQSLKQSFNSAFQQSSKSHVGCELCPMHQLHKLAQEIEGLQPGKMNEAIVKRIEQLHESEHFHIMSKYKEVNPHGYVEMNATLMTLVRHLCEAKQRDHTHITDLNNKTDNKFTLMIKPTKPSKFDDFASKAKKSLASSFENLIKGKKKTEESREAFRDRSCTSLGQSTFFQEGIDSEESTPCSSPYPLTEELPDIGPNDIRRPRSSTIGAGPTEEQRKSLSLKHVSDLNLEHIPPSMEKLKSPRRSIFDSTVGPQVYKEPFEAMPLSPSVLTTPLRRKSSYRTVIFSQVNTPARKVSRALSSDTCIPELDGLSLSPRPSCGTIPEAHFNSKEDVKAMWVKAIEETIILIRMEKENKKSHVNQDTKEVRQIKLDYEEITACLKNVTKAWDEMLNVPLRRQVSFHHSELINCVRKGIPRAKRGEIWKLLTEQHILHPENVGSHQVSEDIPYEDLLKQLTTHQHAILIDLGRTFPQHAYFSGPLGAGQLALFNVLKAYSLLDKEVGYCQGLSFVAGILLLHMPEEEAYNTLKFLMYNFGLRRQYKPDMITLQIRMYQLSRLLHDHCSDLYEHFEENEIHPTLYAASWFLTLFSSQFPLGFVARVFDLLFLYGFEVIFKVALVLLDNHKELIMACDSFEYIVDFLKTTLPEMGIIQMEKVINQVFSLDITKKLEAYEVEYHVLQEEVLMATDNDAVEKLEKMNSSLISHKMELLEQLQAARNTIHSLETSRNHTQDQNDQLKKQARNLELERSALLGAISKLRKLIPADVLAFADLNLPLLDDISSRRTVSTKISKAKGMIGEHSAFSLDSEGDGEIEILTRTQSESTLNALRSRHKSTTSIKGFSTRRPSRNQSPVTFN